MFKYHKSIATTCLIVITLAGCGGGSGHEPKSTLDPCSPEGAAGYVGELKGLISEFSEIEAQAVNTPRILLPMKINQLEEIQIALENLEVPPCMEDLKFDCGRYMRQANKAFNMFLNKDSDSDAETEYYMSALFLGFCEGNMKEWDNFINP
jgi:hypothetical protein